MGTLIKRKGLSPSMMKKSVNNFFDDFTTIDLSDWTDKNFAELGSKLPANDDPLIIFSEKEEVRKNDNYTRREFNYRSFCRLPNY